MSVPGIAIACMCSAAACTSAPTRPTPALDALAAHVPKTFIRTATISDQLHRALPPDAAGIQAIQADCQVTPIGTMDPPTDACIRALAERISRGRTDWVIDIIGDVIGALTGFD